MTKTELIIEIENLIDLDGDDFSDGEVIDKIVELIKKEKL